jgi:hypothetical protein
VKKRNFYEDYMQAVGEEPSLKNDVTIMTDIDNTKERPPPISALFNL